MSGVEKFGSFSEMKAENRHNCCL